MYGNFCFPHLFPNFNMGIPFSHQFSNTFYQLPFNKLQNTCPKLESQSYTTKQFPVKQEQILVQKQELLDAEVKGQEKNIDSKQRRKNKSIFHNYQKHLVTTLKQKITSQEIQLFDSQDSCLRELWREFNASKIANRTLLLAVFGEEKCNQSQILINLQKCRFSGLTDKYQVQQIMSAQGKIREIVKQYFKNKNLQSQLSGRKLPSQQRNLFKHYISYFLYQLEQGKLNRRLPKQYKRQMMF